MSNDPLDLPAKEALRAARKEQEQQAARLEIEDVKWLMSDKRGRRFVWRQLSKAGVFRTSFTGNGSETFFNEGKRVMGLDLMVQINEHCPNRYNEMVTEQTTQ